MGREKLGQPQPEFPGLGRLLELAGRNMAVAAGVVVQIALVVFFRP